MSRAGKTLRLVKSDIYTYIGLATIGSHTSESIWQIKRLHYEGTVFKKLFAGGNTGFDKSWDLRGTYEYA